MNLALNEKKDSLNGSEEGSEEGNEYAQCQRQQESCPVGSSFPFRMVRTLVTRATAHHVSGDFSKALNVCSHAIETINGMEQTPQVVITLKDLKQRVQFYNCLLYTSPSPRDRTRSRMPSSA